MLMKIFSKKPILKLFVFFVLFGFSPISITAQSTLNASGGSQTLSSGIHEYSIGEMMLVSTKSTPDLTVTQGLLQIESSSLGVSQEVFSKQELAVFPNPTNNTLYIKPGLQSSGELSVQLFDLLGRRILQKTFFLQTGLEKQKLDLTSLQEATYMLNVQFNHGKQSYRQTYKIIKSSAR